MFLVLYPAGEFVRGDGGEMLLVTGGTGRLDWPLDRVRPLQGVKRVVGRGWWERLGHWGQVGEVGKEG